ncbi:MAG: response regulator transcription factor [Peptoniphilus sp.]|nr:response regulator transcription factor [Peptoniphilus sp.]
MNKILIVEDDGIISKLIEKNLINWGYHVMRVEKFDKVMEYFERFMPNLVIMDVTLPFYNGYYWCREIRKVSNVPIVFLSSASENLNAVMAMDMGADDYITKPFDMEVLLAKIKALFRRSYDFVSKSEKITYKGLELNLSEMTISHLDKREVLTKNEFKILEMLLVNKGQVLSREKIMVRLWQSDEYIDDNTLTVNVSRLRAKLKAMGFENIIHTKVGVGYYVEAD